MYPDITKTCEKLISQNPVEKIEQAQQLARQNAQFFDGFIIHSIGYKYKINKEIAQLCFGYIYDGIQIETCKKVWIKTEPMTDDETMKKFKTLKVSILYI